MRRRDFHAGAVATIVGLSPTYARADAQPSRSMTRWAADRLADPATQVIRIPPGEHHFDAEGALRRHLSISNNDPGENAIVFPVIGRRRLVIEGNGSRLVFHGKVTPFAILDSQDVTLRNLTIDWQVPFHCEGEILRLDPAGKWVEVHVPEQFRYRVSDSGQFYFQGEGFEQEGIKNLLEFDAARRESSFETRDNFVKTRNGTYRQTCIVKEIAPRVLRIELGQGFATPLTVGNRLLIMPPERICPAVFTSDSRRVRFENVIVRHAGCMGFVTQMTEDVALAGCEVAPDPRGDRFVSTNVDATHFVNCSGLVHIADGRFSNHMDDAVNVHGIYLRILHRNSDGMIVAERADRQQRGVQTIRVGDVVSLSDKASVDEYHRSRVDAVRYPDDRLVEMRLATLPKRPIGEGDVINTISRQPRLMIERCSIARNRARGMLISTLGEAVVRDNVIHAPGSAIHIAGGVDSWYEAGPTSNILITGNTFDNCRYGVWGRSVISIECADARRGAFDTPFHGRIRIENNRFSTFHTSLVSAYRVRDLAFTGNSIERSNAYPAPARQTAPISVETVARVSVARNEIDGFDIVDMVKTARAEMPE